MCDFVCPFTGVIFGVVVSYGLCSLMGLFFGPLHSVLPFLLLGIGIDDMFVITQCFSTLTQEEKELPLPDRFGKTMQHAGVAITVTSVTDIIAFAIGGTTVLPALKSFCLYASVGIVAIYVFQCTFFVACMSIDQRRIEVKRDSCCPCWKHSNWTPNSFSQKSMLESMFTGYGRLLTKWPIKVIVILVTCGITGVGIWGNILLRQEFDMTWFIPPGTYLSDFFIKNKEYFPFGGDRVTVFCHDLDYVNDYFELDNLVKQIEAQTDIVDNVDSWTNNFNKYMNDHFVNNGDPQMPGTELAKEDFRQRLTQFLFSPLGAKWRNTFNFNGTLTCGQSAPKLVLSDITFRHRIFTGE